MSSTWEEPYRLSGAKEQGLSSSAGPILLPSVEADWVYRFEKKLEEGVVDSTEAREKKKQQEDLEEPLPSFFEVQRQVSQRLIFESQDIPNTTKYLEAIIDQVATAIRVLEQPHLNGGMLRLSLQNVGILDGVRVDMHMHEAVLQIAFFAEETLAYDFLKKNLPQLQKTLEHQALGGVKSFQMACYEEGAEQQQDADRPLFPKNTDEKEERFGS